MPRTYLQTDPRLDAVGRKIRERRLALKLSQEQLAERLGIDRVQVYRHENGLHGMDLGTLFQYAEALETDVEALIPKQAGERNERELVRQAKEIFPELSDASLGAIIAMAQRLQALECQAG